MRLSLSPFRAILCGALALATFATIAPNSHAGGKKDGMRIGFLVEGEESDGPNRVRPFTVAGEQKFFNFIPVVTNKNFVAYYPFPAADGSFGAAFLVDERGMTALSRMALQNKGRLLLPFVNKMQQEPLMIDQAQGNYIVIWSGFTRTQFEHFEKEWKLKPIAEPSDIPRRR